MKIEQRSTPPSLDADRLEDGGDREQLIIDGLRLAQELCFGQSHKGGWWTDLETGEQKERNVGEMIALMHSELSESLEGYRKDQMDDHLPHRPMVEVELADTIIRILDFAGGFDLDVAGALIEKVRYNANRADHKLENRSKQGGKKI